MPGTIDFVVGLTLSGGFTVTVALTESTGALLSLTVIVSRTPLMMPAVYVQVALPWQDAASDPPECAVAVQT